MLSYTASRNLFGDLAGDDSAGNLTLGDTLINNAIRAILRSHAWYFRHKTGTVTLVASTQFYDLPHDFERLIGNPYVTSGSYRHVPRKAPTRAFWDRLNSGSNTSTTPEWFLLFDGQIGLWPSPASALTMTIPYSRRVKDLSVADYTTGTITTIATSSGTTTITGTGTTWTNRMIGRFIRVTEGDGTGTGDGEWYEIATVPSTTTLTLVKAYAGNAIATATAAYTIGQMSILPEDFHEIPIYHALVQYFSSVKPNLERASAYRKLYESGLAELRAAHGSPVNDPMIEDDEGTMENPNLFQSY